MKSRSIGILAFLVIFFAGDRLLSMALDALLSQTHFRYATLYNGHSNAEVLIFGNSRAVNSFYGPAVERHFGTSCLNLGYNGMSPDVIHALLLDYLDRNEAPRLLIVEATCVDNESTCILNLKPFWHRSTRLSQIARAVYPQSFAAAEMTRLFAFNCELFLRALSYRSRSDQTWINRYAIDEDLLQQTDAMSAVLLELPTDAELAELRAFTETAEAYGIDCQVVIAPYLPEYRRALSNFDDFKARIASATGRVIDLSDAIQERRFFADRLHTNYAGRQAVIEAAERKGVFRAMGRTRRLRPVQPAP
jgi:hypothetical protein